MFENVCYSLAKGVVTPSVRQTALSVILEYLHTFTYVISVSDRWRWQAHLNVYILSPIILSVSDRWRWSSVGQYVCTT
jgi:hypothetical protein